MDKSNWIEQCRHFRAIPLDMVLLDHGASKDIHDKGKWHTTQGPISITGLKFFNWHQEHGGGGAIDLVMHLKDCDFSTAIAYLNSVTHYQRVYRKRSNHYLKVCSSHSGKELVLPVKNNAQLHRVTSYLIKERKLPQYLIYKEIESGSMYADTNANAVFLMKRRHSAITGAELRGTTWKKYRGLAPGSNKQKGAFYTGSLADKTVSLCESAIDALSYSTLFPNTLAISTAGATPHVAWIDNFIEKGLRVICAFDNDETGNRMADKMIQLHPEIKRHRPDAHDWNDALKKREQ